MRGTTRMFHPRAGGWPGWKMAIFYWLVAREDRQQSNRKSKRKNNSSGKSKGSGQECPRYTSL